MPALCGFSLRCLRSASLKALFAAAENFVVFSCNCITSTLLCKQMLRFFDSGHPLLSSCSTLMFQGCITHFVSVSEVTKAILSVMRRGCYSLSDCANTCVCNSQYNHMLGHYSMYIHRSFKTVWQSSHHSPLRHRAALPAFAKPTGMKKYTMTEAVQHFEMLAHC